MEFANTLKKAFEIHDSCFICRKELINTFMVNTHPYNINCKLQDNKLLSEKYHEDLFNINLDSNTITSNDQEVLNNIYGKFDTENYFANLWLRRWCKTCGYEIFYEFESFQNLNILPKTGNSQTSNIISNIENYRFRIMTTIQRSKKMFFDQVHCKNSIDQFLHIDDNEIMIPVIDIHQCKSYRKFCGKIDIMMMYS